ncbi:MAG TPA: serine hydrolase domain-containing protein [Terracidiphilus sp.]|jgi:CubicO group peptidase (beta-lactamase class C family)
MTSDLPLTDVPPNDGPRRFANVYRVLETAISTRAFPGCAFGVLCGEEVVLHDALGRFTYGDDAAAVTPQTIFDVASLTKVAATTAAAMLLKQRGQLDLETPVAELLPGFVVGRPPGTWARHVKLRHLLAHNSGLPGYVEFFLNRPTPSELFRACLDLPIEAPPGERAEYSDPGFILLGKALEMIMHQPLPAWARREIFHPLGMRATGFNPPAAVASLIPPTEEDTTFRKRIVQGEVQDENAWILNRAAGHAGLFSNVPDLLRFAGEILRAGRHVPGSHTPEPELFEAATIDLFSQRQGPEGSSRGLGWDTPSENSSSGRHFSLRSIGHLGYSGCSLWIDLSADICIVLLTNRTWPDRKNQAIREVRPVFHDAVREGLER